VIGVRSDRVAGIGLLLWAAIGLGFGGRIGVISVLLLLGPLVVVPLGIGLLRPQALSVCLASPFAAAAVVLRGISDDTNPLAVCLAATWFLAALIAAAPPCWQWIVKPKTKRFEIAYLLPLAALSEFCVAAAWLVAATMRIELLGFSESIVLLTAVHFHMAGFGACTVAWVRIHTASSEVEKRWAGRAAFLVLAASPVVAIGHLTAGLLELSGGLLLTFGVWTISGLGWREAARSTGMQRWLLRLGALAPIVPMLLAVHYGMTRVSDIAPLSYNTIALVHGSLNALGFLAVNLLAQTLSPTPAVGIAT
jgi:YndJ-like protein